MIPFVMGEYVKQGIISIDNLIKVGAVRIELTTS